LQQKKNKICKGRQQTIKLCVAKVIQKDDDATQVLETCNETSVPVCLTILQAQDFSTTFLAPRAHPAFTTA
jgi:uncharacterized protein YkvS